MAKSKAEKQFEQYIDSEISQHLTIIEAIMNKVDSYKFGDSSKEVAIKGFIESTMWQHVCYLAEAKNIASYVFNKEIELPKKIEEAILSSKKQQLIVKDDIIELPNGIPVDALVDQLKQSTT